jgi:hypothetical protein
MHIDFQFLIAAIVLLCAPLGLVIGRRRRKALVEREHHSLVSLPDLLISPWSWLDLARALGASWMLLYKVVVPGSTPMRPTEMLLGAVVQIAPLVVGTVLQIVVTGSLRVRLAPLFYIIGITVLMVSWPVALFGLLLGLALTGMLRHWRLIFWLMPPCLMGAAMLFHENAINAGLVALLYFLPALLSLNPGVKLVWAVFRTPTWKTGMIGRRMSSRRRRFATPRGTEPSTKNAQNSNPAQASAGAKG